jgi:hypothetical protein
VHWHPHSISSFAPGHVGTRPLHAANGCFTRHGLDGGLGRRQRPRLCLDRTGRHRPRRVGPRHGGVGASDRRSACSLLLLSQVPLRGLDLTDPGRVLLRRPVEDNGTGL